MGSLSEYGKTVGGVHSLGDHIVWGPKCRPLFAGRVADWLRELIVGKTAERGRSVKAPTTRPAKGQP